MSGFNRHESAALNLAFRARPFQGVEPEKATFLFVGLDANYDPEVEHSPIFPQILEYLADGVGFWRRHRLHHPFLLDDYRGDGKKYHRAFSSIGFRPEHAAHVSFIELIHIPTSGQSKLRVDDLDRDHLSRLRRAIEEGEAKYIFIPPRVGFLMASSRLFPWMPKTPQDEGGPLKVWARFGNKTLYWHYHLSVYGIFEQPKRAQLRAIGELVAQAA
jgi:hypothetical protein